jgi:hypothetical protein
MGPWKRAIVQVMTNGPVQASLGTFKTNGHKLWERQALEPHGHLFWQHKNQVEVYGCIRWGCYTHLCTSCSGQIRGVVATVEEVAPGMVKVCSVTSLPVHLVPPANFLDVLHGWGQTWVWGNLKVTGGTDWMAQAIAENSLVMVTDGSYIKEHYPDLCSMAFVLECTQGQGGAVVAFPEASAAANAFWGEVLGLMAVHLLLLVVNTIAPGLNGCVKIYSDCLSALGCVAKLPTYRIPRQC